MSEEHIFTTRTHKLTMNLADASAWDVQLSPDRRDGYTVIGSDEGGERALVAYDSLSGASSRPLADGIPGEWIMDREQAEELHDRILVMDGIYWPGFNPVLVRVEDREVVERYEPPEQSDA